MPAYARREIVASDVIAVYHCFVRCVRRAFLCGVDPLTDKDHEHRKTWVRDRLEQLASIFAIEVCGYAVMSNHIHVVLRTRPDLVQNWTDSEVATRWLRLPPMHDLKAENADEPSELDINMTASNPERMAELRARLSSLSWFMRCLNEPIARAANREDHCTGRFWEGRFKSQALLDEAAILACSAYVDLNPIRAEVADTPEQSEHTSAFDRIRSMQAANGEFSPVGQMNPEEAPAHATAETSSTGESGRRDAWLCEFTLQEGPNAGADASPTTADVGAADVESTVEMAESPSRQSQPKPAARASNQGFLPMEFSKYLSLLDWTGREIRAKARGAIPEHLAPILERLNLNGDCWVDTVKHFGRWFKRAVGRRDTMAAQAKRSGRKWFQGQRAAAIAFR
jgi:REP element-mobilizing transposase RayT